MISSAGVLYSLINAEEVIELPIIMYHSVLKDKNKTSKYIVTPESVEEDLIYLTKCGYKSVRASDIIKYVADGETLPEKPYLLTFDDGCYNNLTYVLPLLEKYDAYAVISVVGKYSEEFSQSDEVNAAYSYLRWSDINTLKKSGRVEFANHSYNMHSIDENRIGTKKISWESESEYIKRFSEDCNKTQKLLKENCDIEPIIYTYPFGAYCNESNKYLNENGFVMTFSCTEGINAITRNMECLKLLKRLNRHGNAQTEEFYITHKIK